MKKTTAAKSADERLAKMLEHRTFQQLLKSGEVLDVHGAKRLLGYDAEWSVRRLCRLGKLAHVTRFGQYFFLREDVLAAFRSSPAKA